MSEGQSTLWTVIGPGKSAGFLKCRCRCGTVRDVRSRRSRPETLSCGCLRRQRLREAVVTHDRSRTPTYSAWKGMLRRTRPDYKQRKDYADRGVSVCRRWLSFAPFLSDMGDRPPGMTLERKDNNGGYWCGNPDCPDCGPLCRQPNCRWATRADQVRNRRNSRTYTLNGKTQALTLWAREFGIRYAVLLYRVRTGDSLEEAVARKRYQRRGR